MRHLLIRTTGHRGSIVYKAISTNFRRICMLKDFVSQLNMTKTESEVQEIYDLIFKKNQKTYDRYIKNILGASKTLDDEFIGRSTRAHLQERLCFKLGTSEHVVGRRKRKKMV